MTLTKDRNKRSSTGRAGSLLIPVWFSIPLLILAMLGCAQASEVFIYSSQSTIRGIDLDTGTDRFLTSSPYAAGVNALAQNVEAGIVYYGDQNSVYRWNPALGSGPAAHQLMNDFSIGPVTAPIRNINSTAGSFVAGKYYVGSESAEGYIEDLFELTMSIDGTQVVSARALDLQGACNCTSIQLGGFGDVAALDEGGVIVIYGSSADLSGAGLGTSSGRWKFIPAAGTFQLLSSGSGGQMSASPSGRIYSNVGNDIREVNKTTGAISGTTLMTTSAPIYDFTDGFTLDFGDAPDSYGAAYHRLDSAQAAWIGSVAPDNESGALNQVRGDTDGSGDDLDGVDDEDAVAGTVSVSNAVSTHTLTVQCSPGVRVSGWIDRDIDGVFDSDERNANHPVTCDAGTAVLTWSGMLSATSGNTYLRLRASTNLSAISNATGVATDGEVEDHPVSIAGGNSTSGNCPAGSTSTLYGATDLPLTIGPNARTITASTINVADDGTVVDVNVLSVEGTHDLIDDLVFDLRHGGRTRRLYNSNCSSQADFSLGFDDDVVAQPPCPPVDGGIYASRQSLDRFEGQDAAGDWELAITDRTRGNGGALSKWTLEICTSGTSVVETPDIVLGKEVVVEGRNLTIRLVALNNGNVTVNDLALTDDLDTVLGTGNYSITASPVILSGPAGSTANQGFDGSSDVQLLGTSTSLQAGESITVEVGVHVDVIAASSEPGLYANQARITASGPSGQVLMDLSGPGLDVSLDSDEAVTFRLDASAHLAGTVFLDTSGDPVGAHDGIRQAQEPGVAGRQVRALDGNAQVLATTSSDASGNWELLLDPAWLNQPITIAVQGDTLSRFISEAAAYTTGSVSDGQLLVTPAFGDRLTGLDVGIVNSPSLGMDHAVTVTPGTVVVQPHEWLSSTHGSVDFSLAQVTSPAGSQWTASLLEDLNCNQVIDGGEPPWSSARAVVAEERICLLLQSSVPPTATDGAVASSTLTATLEVADLSATGHGLSFVLDNRDDIQVIRLGSGRLELVKQVSNVSTGGNKVSSNAAKPGQTLQYTIEYRNAGDGPLSDVLIEDAAPAFTQVQASSVSCDNTPVALTCTPGSSGDAVSWEILGSLGAGQSGTVSYQVIID